MSRTGSRVSLVQLIPLTLLFCLVPFGIYYLFYYQSSYAYMIDRNMRSVARVAKLTEERLANFYRVIENSVGTAKNEEESELQKSAETVLGYVPDLEYVSLDYKKPIRFAENENEKANGKKNETSIDEATPVYDSSDQPPQNRKPSKSTSIVAIHESKGTKLRLTYRGLPQVSKFDFESPVTISADVFLRDLVGDLDRDDLFDEVAILDDKRNVLLQTDPHGPRLAQFLSSQPAIGFTEKSEEVASTSDKESATKTLTLGNEVYRVFWQPIQLNLKVKDERRTSFSKSKSKAATLSVQSHGDAFFVYGIVKESSLKRAALRIEVIPLLVLVFLLLMAAAAWPLLKVALLGTRDRLSAFDIHLIKLAIVSGVAIVTIFILGSYHYYNLLIKVDKGLLTLSKVIEDNLRREIKQVVRQLKDAGGWEKLGCIPKQGADPNDPEETCQYPKLLKRIGSPKTLSSENEHQLTYHGVGMFITADSDGQQLAKWTIRDKNTPAISAADREYYQKIKRQKYDFDCTNSATNKWCDAGMPSYVVSPIRSNNTGKKLTMVLIEHPKPDNLSEIAKRNLFTMQMTTQLESLWEAVLPLGFGFAIIDSDGFVLYHSDNRLSLEENLFHEIKNPNKLQTVIGDNQYSTLTIQYHGERHRALGTKLASSPWSLVVFSKTIYFETVILESTLSSLVFSLTILAIVSLIRIIYIISSGRPHSRWIWYASEKSPLYDRAITVFSVSGAFSIALTLLLSANDWLSSSWAFILSIFWSLVAIYVAWWILGKRGVEALNREALQPDAGATGLESEGRKNKKPLWKWMVRSFQQWDPRRKYLALLASFLVFMGILPTTVFFLSWYNAQKGALQYHIATDLENQRTTRMLKIREHYQNVESADADFIEKRNERLFVRLRYKTRGGAKDSYPKYYPAVYWYSPLGKLGAPKAKVATDKTERLVASLFTTFPAHNEFALGLREGIKQGVEKVLRDPFYSIDDDNIRSIPVDLVYVVRIVYLIVFILFVLSLYRIVQYVAEKILGLGVALLSTDCITGKAPKSPYELHLNIAKEDLEKLIKEKQETEGIAFLEIDMRRLDVVDEIESALGSDSVILHHFESLLIRSDVRLDVLPKTLDLLEELILINPPKKVIVCSQIDPVYYLNERRQDDRAGTSEGVRKKENRRKKGESEEALESRSQETLSSDDIIRCAEVFSQFIRIQHRRVLRRDEDVRDDFAVDIKQTAADDERKTTPLRETYIDEPRSDLKHSDRPMEDKKTVADYIESELDWDDELRTMKESIIEFSTNQSGKKLTIEELLQKIAYCAAPRYRFLWTLCTNTEKIALLDLASEGTINPKNWKVITELVARGLVRWHYGTYFVACHTFERFILQAMRPDDVAKLRRVTPSAWSWIAIPLLVLLVTSFAFFFWSQPEFAESILAVLGAGTAGVAGLVRLLSILRHTPEHYER